MNNEDVLQELARLYLELRDMKERIAKLEAERQQDGKVVLTGTPSYVRDFIEAKKKLGKGDIHG